MMLQSEHVEEMLFGQNMMLQLEHVEAMLFGQNIDSSTYEG